MEERILTGCKNERVHSIDDLNLAVKWMFIEESTFLPRQTLCPSVKFPTADDRKDLGSGKTDYDLTWKASKSIGKRTGLHVNIGYTWMGNSSGEEICDILHWGVAVDCQVMEFMRVIGEAFGEEETGENEISWQYNLGLRLNASDDLKLVTASGFKISGNAPDFTAVVGMIWVLGGTKNCDKQ